MQVKVPYLIPAKRSMTEIVSLQLYDLRTIQFHFSCPLRHRTWWACLETNAGEVARNFGPRTKTHTLQDINISSALRAPKGSEKNMFWNVIILELSTLSNSFNV